MCEVGNWLETKNIKTRSWQELEHLVKNDMMHLVGRDPKITTEYENHQKWLANEWRSINDYVLFKFFELPYHLKDGLKEVIVPETNSSEPEESHLCYKITENEFPYFVDDNIHHYVLWSTRPLSPPEVETCLEKEKSHSFKKFAQVEWIWKRHGEDYRSVKGVWHVQVFVLQKKHDGRN
ncbi:hypothetical protein AKO1_012060 [Acrasis kona]|uniref:Uncharacterized protein n=1 Tax=Acrasis kona TaxID=1008807 RepID=A0AAW2ZBD5_9EUKA